MLYTSTTDEGEDVVGLPSLEPPPNATISRIDEAAS
jgi:hypothetical protein